MRGSMFQFAWPYSGNFFKFAFRFRTKAIALMLL